MPHSQRIVIRIKKGRDGRTALSCTRADGTTTWQRQEGAQAAFFPKHDLTHYAVETVLGQREGFYGLISAGWDFSDFSSPWPRGRLPLEANISEIIVGVLDVERRMSERGSVDELNQKLAEFSDEKGLPRGRELTEEDLARVRAKRAELFEKWDAMPPGEALEIPFELEPAEASGQASGANKRRRNAKTR